MPLAPLVGSGAEHGELFIETQCIFCILCGMSVVSGSTIRQVIRCEVVKRQSIILYTGK